MPEHRPYTCPCRRCGNCGQFVERNEHPIDGLAYGCRHCGWDREWWAVAGPHMDGRHMTSAEDEATWRAYDDTFLAMGRL